MVQICRMNRLTIIAVLIILASCSGETSYESFIQNRTDRDIKVLLYNNGFPRGDTLRLSPNSTKLISRGSSNQAEEEEPDCAEQIDSAYVEIDGGGIPGKGYLNRVQPGRFKQRKLKKYSSPIRSQMHFHD